VIFKQKQVVVETIRKGKTEKSFRWVSEQVGFELPSVSVCAYASPAWEQAVTLCVEKAVFVTQGERSGISNADHDPE